MNSLYSPSGRALMLAAVVLLTIGALGVIPSLVGLVGLLLEGRFTWDRASSSLIVLLCGAIVLGGGILLYRRARA
ncbi:MAG TPA: hypothetical protein VHG30_17525 [Microvirga sp.]|nr:hypothetical protein [Microvirga sp.]